MKSLWIIVIIVALIMITGAIIVFGGYYDVSAMSEEGPLGTWLFSTVMVNSVERQAADIEVPPLGDSAQVVEGFEHFNEMCTFCHGAPGVSKSESGEGLNPKAPNLAKTTVDLTDAQLFWIIKNGIRMTGMPAYGVTHSDDKLWAIAAFVRRMEKTTPEEYEHLVKSYQEMPSMESVESVDHPEQ
jgi:mono/diheme cytochrome c family protein